MDFTRHGLAHSGFEGFVTVADLWASSCADVARIPGIYVVLREDADPPTFLTTSRGGHFKSKDPTVPVRRLTSKWVAGATVLYIGMTTRPLKARLDEYMRYGKGEPVGHQGGRFIWQLADASKLQVCWRRTEAHEAENTESLLMIQFMAAHHEQLPFANIRGPRRAATRR